MSMLLYTLSEFFVNSPLPFLISRSVPVFSVLHIGLALNANQITNLVNKVRKPYNFTKLCYVIEGKSFFLTFKIQPISKLSFLHNIILSLKYSTQWLFLNFEKIIFEPL